MMDPKEYFHGILPGFGDNPPTKRETPRRRTLPSGCVLIEFRAEKGASVPEPEPPKTASRIVPNGAGVKAKITEAGQPCRHCQTPVILRQHKKMPPYKPGGYWYRYWLACPKCRALYMLESEKVFFDGQPSTTPAN